MKDVVDLINGICIGSGNDAVVAIKQWLVLKGEE